MREYKKPEKFQVKDVFTDPRGMVQRVRDDQAARARWAETTDPAELRELTARWLLAQIDHHPVYPGGGPDDETRPIALPLAFANRGGLLTVQSQPGAIGPTYVQRAFVDGYATPETTARLRKMLPPGVCLVVRQPRPSWSLWRPESWRTVWGPAMGEVGGREVAHLPAHRLTRREISAEWGHRLNDEALDQMEAMDQILVFPAKRSDDISPSIRYLHNPAAEEAMWEALRRFGEHAQYGVRVLQRDPAAPDAWGLFTAPEATNTEDDDEGNGGAA